MGCRYKPPTSVGGAVSIALLPLDGAWRLRRDVIHRPGHRALPPEADPPSAGECAAWVAGTSRRLQSAVLFPSPYSHSMVSGGFDVMSYTARGTAHFRQRRTRLRRGSVRHGLPVQAADFSRRCCFHRPTPTRWSPAAST